MIVAVGVEPTASGVSSRRSSAELRDVLARRGSHPLLVINQAHREPGSYPSLPQRGGCRSTRPCDVVQREGPASGTLVDPPGVEPGHIAYQATQHNRCLRVLGVTDGS